MRRVYVALGLVRVAIGSFQAMDFGCRHRHQIRSRWQRLRTARDCAGRTGITDVRISIRVARAALRFDRIAHTSVDAAIGPVEAAISLVRIAITDDRVSIRAAARNCSCNSWHAPRLGVHPTSRDGLGAVDVTLTSSIITIAGDPPVDRPANTVWRLYGCQIA